MKESKQNHKMQMLQYINQIDVVACSNNFSLINNIKTVQRFPKYKKLYETLGNSAVSVSYTLP